MMQSVQDTQAVDPAVVDSAQSDTTGTVAEMSQEVGSAVDMLASGDIESFSGRMVEFYDYFVVTVVPKLITAFLVFLLMYIVYRVIRAVLVRVFNSSKHIDAGLSGLLLKTFSILAWTIISIMVLAQFGVDVTALLAGLSIAGLAVGFAAKDSLENFISGVTIMIDRPFRVGDHVAVDGTYGVIKDITLRSTRMLTLKNEIMVMPNVLMINQKLINHTLAGLLRIDVPFGIAYKESTEAARSVLVQLANSDARIAADYPVEVVTTGLGDSSVDMELRFFVRESKFEVPMMAEYTEKIFKTLKAADIEIPFPHLQLFIDEAKGLQNMQGGGPSGGAPPAAGGEEGGVSWAPLS